MKNSKVLERLSDEDLHQLVEEIRIAIGPADSDAALGTILMINDWPLARLWTDLLRVRRVGATRNVRPDRELQIFLDRVVHLATPHDVYLLDKSFEGLLDDHEKSIAAELSDVRDLTEKVLKADPSHATAIAVRRALEQFGAP